MFKFILPPSDTKKAGTTREWPVFCTEKSKKTVWLLKVREQTPASVPDQIPGTGRIAMEIP